MADDPLGRDDLRRLREELLRAFPSGPTFAFLSDVAVPAASWPDRSLGAQDAWHHVIQQISSGAMADFRPLLTEAARIYAANAVFRDLLGRYSPLAGPEPDPPVSGPATADLLGARPTVQAFISARDESDRRKILAELAPLGPTLRFGTASTILLEFATTDTDLVFHRLASLPLEWTVVPPGQPAYLLSRLTVEGPDGRRFRLGDMPSASLIEDLTSSLLEEYPSLDGNRLAVADRVRPDGAGERIPPYATLHEAGLSDDTSLRVSFDPIPERKTSPRVPPTLTTETSRSPDIFISYAKDDEPWAAWIAWVLEEHGYRTLIQAWDFVGGSDFQRMMDYGVTESQRLLCVVSEAYLASTYGAAEWQAMLRRDPDGRKRLVLAVRVENCRRPGMLGSRVSCDLFGLPQEQAYRRLLAYLQGAVRGRSKPDDAPAFPGSRVEPEPVEFPGEPDHDEDSPSR